jgi:hypothetical protein
MTTPIAVAVAPNFHLPEAPAGRILVAEGADGRPRSEGEWSVLVPQTSPRDSLGCSILLFALPEHLRTSFWEMLQQEGAAEGFDSVAAEVGRFLAFKQLPPPDRAVFQLVLHGAGGTVQPNGLWAVVNLGDDPVVVDVPGLRLLLGAGEGIRFPEEVTAEVIPPEGEAPDILLLVRRPAQSAS